MSEPRFLGIDLGWMGKPTGLAAMEPADSGVRLTSALRVTGDEAIFAWVDEQASDSPVCICGVDAPLVIRNASGIRGGERQLNAVFQRHHAGCHPANLGRPFAAYLNRFSGTLEGRGFVHGPADPKALRQQIEVHPHAASVRLFGLNRIVKYKKGRRADRARELARQREYVSTRLQIVEGAQWIPELPAVGDLKPAEDVIDAILCAYVAYHWWRHGPGERNDVFGTADSGYIVVPR